MKKTPLVSLQLALALSAALSAHALAQSSSRPSAQSTQSTEGAQPTSGKDMSEMDHAAMGHATPAPPPKQTVRKKQAPPKRADDAGRGSAAAVPQPAPESAVPAMDHAAMGHGAAAGQAKPVAQPTQPQAPSAAQSSSADQSHAGHVMSQPQQSKGTSQANPGAQSQGMGQMDHSAMGHANAPSQPSKATVPVGSIDHAAMGGAMTGGQGMQMGPMQGGSPPPDARDPNAYNEGTRHANFGNHEMNDNAPFGRVLLDKAEFAKGDGERGQNIELEAWYGNDYNKLWIKAEGERRGGALEEARTELLWDRAFATFWSTQLGVRHDTGEGRSRDWVAFGVQGLAPYWFETEATAYWRSGSGIAARLSAKYEVLFTPRLILEPELSANLYSRVDEERGTGSGLSDVSAGLRLRYEITRKFAPYIGVTWSRQFGETADFARQRGGNPRIVQAVAGVRLWF